MTVPMHADELAIDDVLVRRLVREQFPEWAGLPLARVEPWGTVHALYRLGDELALRLPRRAQWSDADHLVARWLPVFAPAVPLAIPVPVAQGGPSDGYPCHWTVCSWIDGEDGVRASCEPLAAARGLAAFVAALQRVDAAGGPTARDRLAARDDDVRATIAQMGSRAVEVWEEALAVPEWDGPPVWSHGDLDARNWLVRDGRIVGIVDWDSFGVGDPAADVMVAWKLHSAEAATVFRETLGVDDATWARARGWTVSQAAMALTYYTRENNAALVGEAERWLELVLETG
ncbi:MAG TPA: aminoglycoside phosphotransferase family protein [Gaiellaceae bacterium]|nr:aminoglycoside phosphotransferase family protein [Gaiellaceae bacterium]